MWKILIALTVVLSLGTLGFLFFKTNSQLQEAGVDTGIVLSPFSSINKPENEDKIEKTSNILGDPINVVLLGIDRRKRDEAYRTDIMILVSGNLETKQVVLTSLPRDLWYNGQRLNAVFLNNGWEEFQNAVETITGLRPERYVLTDFKDFSWIVDAMGGVPVNIERTFTDSNYPVDETFEYQTITFTEGYEKLTGSRALIYARSRKGDNGEGSDWMRMQRQHLILKGMLDAVLQSKSIFNPMVVENALKTVTQGKMDTNLSLTDAAYLWDFYKNKNEYDINSMYLDTQYLYSPPMEEYGGAWVLVPVEGTYEVFKKDLYNKLYNINESLEIQDSGSADTEEIISN